MGSNIPAAIEVWPQQLKVMVDLILNAPFGMIVLGPDLVQIYNDACCAVMGAKHPGGLDQPTFS
ncbi:hypothetical protein [Microvirga calopogonii]|uniref:hypothetical protein n=1 Tax=Microvirga calopogonii TaxID=2078013 RepID=UPI000E0DEB24|nr:hypothetical protein [Microvirga calopogonii]